MYIKDMLRMVITKGRRERVGVSEIVRKRFMSSVGERASRDREIRDEGREEGGARGGRKVVSGEGYFYAFKI